MQRDPLLWSSETQGGGQMWPRCADPDFVHLRLVSSALFLGELAPVPAISGRNPRGLCLNDARRNLKTAIRALEAKSRQEGPSQQECQRIDFSTVKEDKTCASVFSKIPNATACMVFNEVTHNESMYCPFIQQRG
ncbi:hypothetical protein ISCGN_008165 [Ixodes scapularis]